MSNARSWKLDNLMIRDSEVTVLLTVNDKSRTVLTITYGREKIEVVDLWSYSETKESPRLRELESYDTLKNYMFVKSEPMVGWFNGNRVIFIHPEKDTGDILLIWCVDTNTVEWFTYSDEAGYPEITMSEEYVSKFGLWSAETYKHIRSTNVKGDN